MVGREGGGTWGRAMERKMKLKTDFYSKVLMTETELGTQ
jgi:hypothetical protein